MIYLLEPSEVTESAIKEYFSYEVLSGGAVDDLLRSGGSVVVYDCTRKAFVREVAELLLKNGNTKVLVVVNGIDLGVAQTDNLKIYNYKKPIEENASEFKEYLIHKVAWLVEPAEDFDHIAYLEDNPDLLSSYYRTQWARENNISDRQKAYHHQLLYAPDQPAEVEKLVSSKSVSLERSLRSEVHENLKRIVDSLAVEVVKKSTRNKLECVCLNMTCKEIDDYKVLVQRLVDSTDPEVSKRFDFVVVINNDAVRPDTEILEGLFKSVSLISLNMSAEEDIYVRPGKENEYLAENIVPLYGLKSGPNIMFLRTMHLLMKCDTSFLVETDCHFGKNWLETLERYVLGSNGFLISGATYDGVVYTKANTANLNHLNGVALYSTGDPNFQALVRHFDCFLREYVRLTPNLAYDFGMKLMIDFGLDHAEDRSAWNFISRNYVVNKHIFNFSTQEDKDLCEAEIESTYNYAVLHKKVSSRSVPS